MSFREGGGGAWGPRRRSRATIPSEGIASLCGNCSVLNKHCGRRGDHATKLKVQLLLAEMFGTAVRMFATKPKPKMKPIELKTPPEQTQTISRVIFDVLKEHGPLTISDTWDRVKEVGLRGLTSKRHMKIVLRWMRERQKLRLICNHVGPQKQFLYTTWFTKQPSVRQQARGPVNGDSWPPKPKLP